MAVNLLLLESGKRFEELCQSVLTEEYPRFQAFSAPDAGMDGYDSDTETIFQIYFPERAPLKSKIRVDLAKARAHGDKCKRWVLLLPKNPTPLLSEWIKAEQAICSFSVEVWGENKLLQLLRRHPAVREQFFPTQLRTELGRLARGKQPAAGDASTGQEITPEQGGELREMITKLGEEEASRKKRKARPHDFQREYGEFNAFFHLSSYERLPRTEFAVARTHLERKLYARRHRQPIGQTRHRFISGIKAIQKDLAMDDFQYRELLFQATGKRSTSDMDCEQLRRVLDRFRFKHGLATTQRL